MKRREQNIDEEKVYWGRLFRENPVIPYIKTKKKNIF